MDRDTIITNKNQLVEYISQGCKPASRWSIGAECEGFIFQIPEMVRAPYEGQRGIRALLEAFQQEGWEPITDLDRIIGLKKDGANISLEPAGQFELSGAPLNTVHETYQELKSFNKQLYRHLRTLDLGVLNHGGDPKTSREDMPWMPKQRYKIMRDYMPTRGNLGLDMMTATCTVQVNLDYESEADCARKFRASMALQPLITAMFANSPIHKGKVSTYKSYRGHIWTDTDPDRSGLLDFVLNGEFSFERYVDYMLQMPMYFVYRDGIYHNYAGHPFQAYMDGKLPGREGQLPLLGDFEDHLTTAFPEVRLKQYLEMRGADGGSVQHMMALHALWTGLLYDKETLDEVCELTSKWSYEDCLNLREDALRHGLQAHFHGHALKATAAMILDLATQGLQNRANYDHEGHDESIYLTYLQNLVERGKCPADLLIEEFTNVHQGNVEQFLRAHVHQGPEDVDTLDGKIAEPLFCSR